jgi:acyl dehydratase
MNRSINHTTEDQGSGWLEEDMTTTSDGFVASYNQRDLILYALSLGFGSSHEADDELKYLYEKHPHFVAVPTFCVVLDFWASKRRKGDGTSYTIPTFPSDIMSSTGTIPREYLTLGEEDPSQFPLLHISQSLTWHCSLPVPSSTTTGNNIRTRLEKRVLSVTPKSIGTFVTSETIITAEDASDTPLCTLQSTFLVLGMPKEAVVPMMAPSDRVPGTVKVVEVPKDHTPDFEWTYVTAPTQALFYRLASGDSNKIHVTGDETMSHVLGLPVRDGKKPILHGLCTLGIATRAILMMYSDEEDNKKVTFSQLQCQFSKPVLTGDTLHVQIWKANNNNAMDNSTRQLIFVVVNKATGAVVVDKGYARLNVVGGPLQLPSKL